MNHYLIVVSGNVKVNKKLQENELKEEVTKIYQKYPKSDVQIYKVEEMEFEVSVKIAPKIEEYNSRRSSFMESNLPPGQLVGVQK